jgi:transposase InsO family protein
MRAKKVIMSAKLTKVGRAYSESVKRKIVGEINCGLLSHREASKKYGINRKSIGNWITQLSLLNLKPLEIAQNTIVDMKEDNKTRIHHSDRGVQYCCSEYIDLLNQEGIWISMTQSGSPYDNALAERVNGIIKNEFYPKRIYQNHKEAVKAISKIVDLYNQKRPHCSIDYLTPAIAHEMSGSLKKRWKTYPRLR